jgi:teichuronic acid biosynthesis glycosyltransferase TuaG
MLEKTNYINCSAVVIKREVMLEYPMKYSNVHEDYYAWLSIMKKYRFAVGVDEPLILYRLSPRGKSRNKLKSALMTYRTYRYAGYSLPASAVMMFWYTINGLRKYRLTNIRRKKADKKVL